MPERRHCQQHTISQLRIIRSDLHLVTYLDMGNFCDKSTERTLHEICVQVLLRFSDSSKPSQSVSLIYELTWLAWTRKSEENLRHDNRKHSASAREHWCDVNCDSPYCLITKEDPTSYLFADFSIMTSKSNDRQLVAQAWRHNRMTSKSHMESHMFCWIWQQVKGKFHLEYYVYE